MDDWYQHDHMMQTRLPYSHDAQVKTIRLMVFGWYMELIDPQGSCGVNERG
jgi:hypothetical protein